MADIVQGQEPEPSGFFGDLLDDLFGGGGYGGGYGDGFGYYGSYDGLGFWDPNTGTWNDGSSGYTIPGILEGITGWGTDQIKDFLTGTLGLSPEMAEQVAQKLKNEGVDAALDLLGDAGYDVGGSGSGATGDESGPVILYEDVDYSGQAVSVGVGEYDVPDLRAIGIGNDVISSLRISDGYKVTLYYDIGFSGQTLVLTDTTRSIYDQGFNDEVSGVKVEKISADAGNDFEDGVPGDDTNGSGNGGTQAGVNWPLMIAGFGAMAGIIWFTVKDA